MNFKTMILILIFTILSSCSLLPSIKSEANLYDEKITLNPSDPQKIKISKSKMSEEEYKGIGEIILRGNIADDQKIFDKFKEESAKYGAHAVHKINIKRDAKQEWQSSQVCTSTGAQGTQTSCSSQNYLTTVYYFTAVGEMLVKK